MANTKITDLTALSTAPDSTDQFVIVDVSDTTMGSSGTDKKLAYSVLDGVWASQGANSDITSLSGLTTPLSVAQGGLGRATLTAGSVVVGNGTSAVSLYTTTGSGTVVALATSPALTTPNIGVATATSVNGITLTSSTGVITITNAKTLTVSDSTTLATNAITLGGGEVITFSATNALSLLTTGTSVMTFPTTTDTVVTLAATQTLTSKRITKRAPAITQSATPAINTDITDVAHITGLAQAITSMTSSLTGTPVEGDTLRIDITDNGTARAITWGASFEASGNVALPTTTVISTRLDVGFLWNTVTSKWRCVGVS